MSGIQISPLTAVDLTAASIPLAALNPDTPVPVVLQCLQNIFAEHQPCICLGAFVNQTLAGVVGAWIATKVWCARSLEIDNPVVTETHRSSGIASRLIHHLGSFAREIKCKVFTLDSYVSNSASHRLYRRLGFEIWGFQSLKPIENWKQNSRNQVV